PGNVGRSSGEEPPLASVIAGRNGAAVSGDPVCDGDVRGLAAGGADQVLHAINPGAKIGQGIERVLRVGSDRVPGITKPGNAAECRLTLASDPQRRVRLLYGLGGHDDVGKMDETAF